MVWGARVSDLPKGPPRVSRPRQVPLPSRPISYLAVILRLEEQKVNLKSKQLATMGSSAHVRAVDQREECHRGCSDAREPGLMLIASMFDCIFNTVFPGGKKLCFVVVLRISEC